MLDLKNLDHAKPISYIINDDNTRLLVKIINKNHIQVIIV